MAAKKPETKTFSVTGTFDNVQISLEVKGTDLETALAEARKLKFDSFITANGDVFDFDGPRITSIWEN